MTWSAVHPRTATLAMFAVLVVSVVLASRVRIESDLLALVPESHPTVATFRDTLDRFGTSDVLLVALELGGQPPSSAVLDWADDLATDLRATPEIEWVEYRTADWIERLIPLLSQASLALPLDELEDLLGTLDEPGLARHAAQLAARVRQPSALATKPLLVADPFDLTPRLFARLGRPATGGLIDADTGYLIDPNRRFLLLLTKPSGAAADLDFCRRLDASVQAALSKAHANWREPTVPPSVLLGGGYMIALADAALLRRDLVVGSGFALVAVATLFGLAFGRWSALVIALGPLVVGLLATVAFAALALGRLNTATTAFAALLAGLGIDFAVILYSRYIEGRAARHDHASAISRIGRETAAAVLVGAVSTSVAFLAFTRSGFRGLAELGLLTGVGILLLATASFVLVPALTSLVSRTTLRGARRRPRRLFAFGLQHLTRLAMARPTVTIIVAALLSVSAGLLAVDLRYDNDMRRLRSPANLGLVHQDRIMDAFGLRFTPFVLRIDGVDEAEATRRARLLSNRLVSLIEDGTLARVDDIVSRLPDARHQEAIIERLDRASIEREALARRIRHALREAGLASTPFELGIERFLDTLTVREPLRLVDLRSSGLGSLVARYVAPVVPEDSANVALATYAYSPATRNTTAPPDGLVHAADAVEGVTLTGLVMISRAIKDVVLRDALTSTALGAAAVLLLLGTALAGYRDVLLALTPLGVGILWMTGMMAVLGVSLNIASVFVFTMVVGIGIDYGVHLVLRWRQSGGRLDAVEGTARAIAIAALTTTVGFGSLALSHVPALRSLGYAAALGATMTALAALTVLPALLARYATTSPTDRA